MKHDDDYTGKHGRKKKEITFADSIGSEDSEDDDDKQEEEKQKRNHKHKNIILMTSSFRVLNDDSGRLDAEYRYEFTPY